MKNIILVLVCCMSLSSCCTLFTSSSQALTFTGDNGIKIYDNTKKIAEIKDDNEVTVKIRKKLSNKTLIAKKEGYKNMPVVLESTFNPIAVINLLNVLAWAVDLGTQKACKWDNEVIPIQMEEK